MVWEILVSLLIILSHKTFVDAAEDWVSAKLIPEFINSLKLANAAPYAVSKAALTTMFAKFNAAYQDEGLLFFTICPGLVDTAEGDATCMVQSPTAQLFDSLLTGNSIKR